MHNSLLARAHSIFRHCLNDRWVGTSSFFTSYKSRTRHWVHFKFLCSYHWRKKAGKTFTGYFSRLAHVFKLGSFVTLLGNDEFGWSLFSGLELQSGHWEMMSFKKKLSHSS